MSEKYAEFRYVNVAVEGVHNRKGIHDVNKLGDPSGKEDTYATYFRYNEEMKEHYDKVKSVKDYKGQAWSDWLAIDIDSEDLEEAQSSLTALVQRLGDYGIDENTCRFYFSGQKGYHVMIPSAYFKAEPSKDIGKRFRKVALELTEGIKIDTSIYDVTRLLRLPNTKHSKTGLHKVELYPREATQLDIRDIQHKALMPVEELDIETDFDESVELTRLYHEELSKPKNSVAKKGAKSKICLETMMYDGAAQGERDNIAIRVASHLTQTGMTSKMSWMSLNEWNESLEAPLETDEVERIHAQGLEGYEFGCKDEFLKGKCNPECIFFKSEWEDAIDRIENFEKRRPEGIEKHERELTKASN